MDKLKLDKEKGKKRFEKKINKTKENELIFFAINRRESKIKNKWSEFISRIFMFVQCAFQFQYYPADHTSTLNPLNIMGLSFRCSTLTF